MLAGASVATSRAQGRLRAVVRFARRRTLIGGGVDARAHDVADVEGPTLVACLTWRAVGAMNPVEVEALAGLLEAADPGYCLQLPTSTSDVYGLSLASAGPARSAADGALSVLEASAAAVGIRYEVLRVEVVSDDTSWTFDAPAAESAADPLEVDPFRTSSGSPAGRRPLRWGRRAQLFAAAATKRLVHRLRG